jgi:hypothetical protein
MRCSMAIKAVAGSQADDIYELRREDDWRRSFPQSRIAWKWFEKYA